MRSKKTMLNFVVNFNISLFKGTPFSKGFDLAASEEVTIQPNQTLPIPLGCNIVDVKFKDPSTFAETSIDSDGNLCLELMGQNQDLPYFMLAPRSSLLLKKNLDAQVGIIDLDFRGMISLVVHNYDGQPATIQKGERIAQLVPHFGGHSVLFENPLTVLKGVRGEGGFGSTGKK